MDDSIFLDKPKNHSLIEKRYAEIGLSIKNPELWIGMIVLAIGLSMFQDYVYSRVQNTGFYLSESLLYNSLWAFLFPLTLLRLRLLKQFNFKKRLINSGVSIIMGGTFALLHILIFSAYFLVVSNVAFYPTHHFSHIFNAALSNQFYVLTLFYILIPFVYRTTHKTKRTAQRPLEESQIITVKDGLKTILLPTESINLISTEKPYSVIYTDGKKYLDNHTLKELESILS